MKKLVTFFFLVLNVLSFSDTFNDNEDERTILKQEQRVEQERLQKEFQKREEDFYKLKLEKTEISTTKTLNLKVVPRRIEKIKVNEDIRWEGKNEK